MSVESMKTSTKTPSPNREISEEQNESLELKMSADDFDCPLCGDVLYQPVTTTCGHTFCKSCICRAGDHTNKCPICRRILHITQDYGVALLLQEVIKKHFPKKLERRQKEIESEIHKQLIGSQLPIFVLNTVLFPTRSLPLHIFEPRYRLMLRRCLEGGRRFGVVSSVNGKLSEYGTVAEIENHVILPDGRSLIHTKGRQKFKLKKHWNQDGYTVGNVEFVRDSGEELDEESTRDLKTCRKYITTMFGQVLSVIEEKFGKMPADPIKFTFWLVDFLPISLTAKQSFLELNSQNERITALKHIISIQKGQEKPNNNPSSAEQEHK